MTDQTREERIYSTRSAYMHYIHTTDMARKHERQRQLAQLDEEIRRNEAMVLKRQQDSRMHTEQAIRELRLEQERRRIKEEQRQHEHEERRRIRNQNKKQLERELERIKNELRTELAKEEIKCHSSDDEDKCQEKKESANMPEREECLEQIEDCRQLAAVELETREHKQRNNERKSPAADQVQDIQDETKEEDHNKDVEHENECFMVQDERSGEEKGTDVQKSYTENSHNNVITDSKINNDTPQEDCTRSSIPYDQLNISHAQTSTLEVLHHTDRQEVHVDQSLEHCIAQECISDDIVRSHFANASLPYEQLPISGTKKTNLEVYHVADLQKKTMQSSIQKYIAQECASEVLQFMIQLEILFGDSEVREMVYAESRDIVIICMNMCLCFKFLWWQEGTLSS